MRWNSICRSSRILFVTSSSDRREGEKKLLISARNFTSNFPYFIKLYQVPSSPTSLCNVVPLLRVDCLPKCDQHRPVRHRNNCNIIICSSRYANKCNLLMPDKLIKIILKLNYIPSPQLWFVAWDSSFSVFHGSLCSIFNVAAKTPKAKRKIFVTNVQFSRDETQHCTITGIYFHANC